MRMRATDLIGALSATGKPSPTPSATKPHRLAIVDTAYDPTTYPTTLPRVTYEGESTLAERPLAVVGPYVPIPGHRVMVAPVGTTYAILGPVNPGRPAKVHSTAAQGGIGTTEVASLTIANYSFAARTAYEVIIRGMAYGTAAAQMHFRLRKTDVAGADWGEYGRVTMAGAAVSQSAIVHGSVVLLRSAATQLTATFALTATMSSGTGTIHASANSPRWMIIRPIGPAALYSGLGTEVT